MLKTRLHDIQVGDVVIRLLGGTPMEMVVSSVNDDVISCGGADGWNFDRRTGAEIDDYLGWGPPPKITGSFLIGRKQ